MLHLVKRFFGHLTARPLTEVERSEVEAALPDELLALFDTMCLADQRHGLVVWDRVGRREDLAQAALLHDIGKSMGPRGAVARSLATVAAQVGVPLSGGWATYRDHGAIGAARLRQAGAEAIAIAFAEFHPGPPPPGVNDHTWQALVDADNV